MAIYSYGIICYRFSPMIKDIEYLLIQRHNSIGYLDIIKGYYPNLTTLKQYIYELTVEELYNLRNKSYEELWDEIYGDRKNKNKFNSYKNKYLNIKPIIDSYDENDHKFCELQWGFPKGRMNKNENSIESAIREFVEETNYPKHLICINKQIPYKEQYISTDNQEYIGVYFLAELSPDYTSHVPIINEHNIEQTIEINDIRWCSFYDAYKMFKKQTSKKGLLYQLHYRLKKNEKIIR